MKVTIYGASDDLVEIEGDIEEEFLCIGGRAFLSFSDGTVLLVEYGSNDTGEWRISQVAVGSAEYTNRRPMGTEYSERASLTGEIQWAMFTEMPKNQQRIFVKAKRAAS